MQVACTQIRRRILSREKVALEEEKLDFGPTFRLRLSRTEPTGHSGSPLNLESLQSTCNSASKKHEMAASILMKRPAETAVSEISVEEKENLVPKRRASVDPVESIQPDDFAAVPAHSPSNPSDSFMMYMLREQELRRKDQEQRREEFALMKNMVNHVMNRDRRQSETSQDHFHGFATQN